MKAASLSSHILHSTEITLNIGRTSTQSGASIASASCVTALVGQPLLFQPLDTYFLLNYCQYWSAGVQPSCSTQILELMGQNQKEITWLKKIQCVNLALGAHLVYLLSKDSLRVDLLQNLRLHTCFWYGSGILLEKHALVMGWPWKAGCHKKPYGAKFCQPLSGLGKQGRLWTASTLHVQVTLNCIENSLQQSCVNYGLPAAIR